MKRLNRLRTTKERDRVIHRLMELQDRAKAAREPRRGLILKRMLRLQRLRQEAEEKALL